MVEPPPGVVPCFLSSTTMEAFKLHELPAEAPYLRVPVKEILKDIQFKGVISDWQPFAKQIEKYKNPDAEGELAVLVVQDMDMVYDQNFYFCITEDAAKEVMAKFAGGGDAAPGEGGAEGAGEGAEPAAPEEEEPRPQEIVDPDLVNRPWKEFEGTPQAKKTSDVIASFVVQDVEPPKLKYALTRRRQFFNQGGKFHDADHVEVEDFKPYRDPQFKENPENPGVFGTRFLQTDVGVQCVPAQVDCWSQTARFRLVNSMVQYAPIMEEPKGSGGTDADRDSLAQSLSDMLERMMPLAEAALMTNETIAVFEDDLANLGDEETLGNTSDNKIKEYSSPFTDINYSKRKIISAIDWMPESKGVVAVSCTEKATMDEQVEMDGKVRSSHILIWNFKDPIHPQFVLEAPGDILTFKFNPKNNNLLAAGCANGQVLYWDLKQAKAENAKRSTVKDEVKSIKSAMASTIDASHRRAVSALQWLPPNKEVAPRTGHIVPNTQPDGASKQIISLAADGMVLFWDLTVTKADKNGALLWTPIFRIMMTSVEGSGDLGGCQLCLAPDEEGENVTKFCCGTEDGELVYATWSLPEEENASYIESSHLAHYGPIVSLERSPFFQDVIMTVGDWTFNLFKQQTKEPILKSSYSPSYLTTGKFSPTRPAVILTGRSDGSIEIWDLMDRSHEPSIHHNVGPVAVTAMEFWGDSNANLQLLAVGDKEGTLHVLEIPRNLRRPVPNEQNSVQALLDREVARVSYMRDRMVFRAKELSVKEAEDEEKRRAFEEAEAKKAAQDLAAKEAAEAAAQALATGEGEVIEELNAEDDESVKKLDKADELAEARYYKIEADFKEKIGIKS